MTTVFYICSITSSGKMQHHGNPSSVPADFPLDSSQGLV